MIALYEPCKAYLACGRELCRLARLWLCSGAKERVVNNSSIFLCEHAAFLGMQHLLLSILFKDRGCLGLSDHEMTEFLVLSEVEGRQQYHHYRLLKGRCWPVQDAH